MKPFDLKEALAGKLFCYKNEANCEKLRLVCKSSSCSDIYICKDTLTGDVLGIPLSFLEERYVMPESDFTSSTVESASAAEKKNNGWISVDEKLPSEGVDVLIFNSHTIIATYRNEKWWVIWGSSDSLQAHNVTHWQPIPPPPEI